MWCTGRDPGLHERSQPVLGCSVTWSNTSRPAVEPQVAPGAPYPNSGPSAAPPAGPRGPTSRIEYGAGSAAPEKTTTVLDSPHDRHISHARDGAGSEVSPHRLTSLLPSHGVRQTGPSAILVSKYYISRTWSWFKVTIWLPSPPMGLTIHIGAQLHGELRGVC